MKLVDFRDPIEIPPTVAICPQCGDRLTIESYQWLTDGTITGFWIWCTNENPGDDEHKRRRPQQEEMYIYVNGWVQDNVRIRMEDRQ